jgi:sugar phosphate isomerase/epimerase
MNIAISTAVLNYLPFDNALKIIRKAGYDYIELAGYWKGRDWEIAQHLKGLKPNDVI